MEMSRYDSVGILLIAVTCFLISIFFIKQVSPTPKNRKKKSCYLNTESMPQFKFNRVLADNSYLQFKYLKLQTADSYSNEDSLYLHPYKAEFAKLIENPNFGFLELLGDDDNKVLEMKESYVWVENEAQLLELAEVLSKETVFGVDTEQHSLRSFLGFTALIQISTVREDYLVDTIKLHDITGLLRPVFADPQICKVLHGADNDVLWLQRDFHIYIVNLFDTAKACDVLSKPERSLAFLLASYCGITTNKLFQKEDWRQRPLSEEMIQYARTDAHDLLYIAHCLCIELKLLKKVVKENLENSASTDQAKDLLILRLRQRMALVKLERRFWCSLIPPIFPYPIFHIVIVLSFFLECYQPFEILLVFCIK